MVVIEGVTCPWCTATWLAELLARDNQVEHELSRDSPLFACDALVPRSDLSNFVLCADRAVEVDFRGGEGERLFWE